MIKSHLFADPKAILHEVSLARGIFRRAPTLLACEGICLATSLGLAYMIRFDFAVPENERTKLPLLILGVVGLKFLLLYLFRQFHSLPDYFCLPDFWRLVYATSVGSVLLGIVHWLSEGRIAPPYGVNAIDFLLSLLLLSGLRLAWRHNLRHRNAREVVRPKSVRRVGIVGAGEAGAMLARELKSQPRLGLEPVALFDDDKRKWGGYVHAVRVLGSPELLSSRLSAKLRLDEVIISMPSAPPDRLREIIRMLRTVSIPFRTVPSLTELATGKIKVSHLRPVEIEDLLGRPAITLETAQIRNLLINQCVMVTGAGGSIGSELCRQIASFGPAQLLLVERSEVQMFVIEQELVRRGYRGIIRPLVADILDEKRMRRIMEHYRPKSVFHAAAHKHVPMMESQPAEAIRNNTLGTVQLAEMAADYGIEQFVLISTDKAINPTSVMGATKRLAEMFLQSYYAAHSRGTRFSAVRFGNVLGSSGSVIPIFKEQIAAGGPVTITHPDITRYFMTIPEAVGLVLQSAVLGTGGEIFVLDMGKPVRIVDLARQLIQLSGFEPDHDIKIEFVGLRPGEKLFEELSHFQEALSPTAHSKILRLCTSPRPLADLRKALHHLTERLLDMEPDQLKGKLRGIVPEYTPALSKPRSEPAPAPLPGPKEPANVPELVTPR